MKIILLPDEFFEIYNGNPAPTETCLIFVSDARITKTVYDRDSAACANCEYFEAIATAIIVMFNALSVTTEEREKSLTTAVNDLSEIIRALTRSIH